MDTAKAANLYNTYKTSDLYDFINAPIGKGLPITKKLSPLVASESSDTIRDCIMLTWLSPDYRWYRI